MDIKNLFKIKIYNEYDTINQIKKKILFFSGLKFLVYSKKTYKISFYWEENFNKYFSQNNIKEKIENLKQDMDSVSCEYIDKFMELSKFWNKDYKNPWTQYDLKLYKEQEALNFEQK